MSVIKGRLGAVYIAQYGAGATAFTDEATTANVAKTVFTIDDAAKRYWDPGTAIVVKYNGGAVTSYQSIQRPGGVVTWAVTPGDSAVTVSGKYLAIAALGQCRSWSLDIGQEYHDITVFGDTARKQMPAFTASTATMEGFYADATLFNEMIGTAARIGFDLFVNATPGSELRYTGFGTISSASIEAAVDGLVEQPVEINISDGPYFVSGLA